MFKCPNCNKMYMQLDVQGRALQCYGGRCLQVIEVPRKLWEGNGIPSRESLQECIDAFRRRRA